MKNYTPIGAMNDLIIKIKKLLSLGYSIREISFLVNKSFNEVSYLLSP